MAKLRPYTPAMALDEGMIQVRVLVGVPINTPMQMLVDWHDFAHQASVPWPCTDNDWQAGVRQLESWLESHVGHRLQQWAWSDSGRSEYIGVAFRWDQHRLLFVLTWH